MRVLVIDEWLPLPLDSGKRIRTFKLLAPLARRHAITYLAYADAKADREKIASLEAAGFRVVCVSPADRFRTPIRLALGLASNLLLRDPIAVRKHFTRRYASVLRKLLGTEDFDLIHCEWTHYSQFLRANCRLPRFLSSHNVESMCWRRFYEVQTNPLRRAAIYLEWLKMRHFEKRAIAEFDHVAAVSDVDAAVMRSSFEKDPVAVIPNGVDTEFYAREPGPSDSEMLVFSASMDAFVNQDAAESFVKSIFPRILARRPEARFMILGRKPPESIRRLASDRVVVTGTVDDIRPPLFQASVSAVPLRIAGGSRLKILEAFAAGVPVVSTSIGAEGLEVVPGKHLLIADGDEAFADACVDLLADAPLRQRLAAEGRKLARQRYDWSSISPSIEEAWLRTVELFRQRSPDRKGGASASVEVDCVTTAASR
jgi:polysaccharide biosynthesis protein PslH